MQNCFTLRTPPRMPPALPSQNHIRDNYGYKFKFESWIRSHTSCGCRNRNPLSVKELVLARVAQYSAFQPPPPPSPCSPEPLPDSNYLAKPCNAKRLAGVEWQPSAWSDRDRGKDYIFNLCVSMVWADLLCDQMLNNNRVNTLFISKQPLCHSELKWFVRRPRNYHLLRSRWLVKGCRTLKWKQPVRMRTALA